MTEVRRLSWRENYPEHCRPSNAPDTPRELWCIQDGIPVHRFVVHRVARQEGDEFQLGNMEHAFFEGRSLETAYFVWALSSFHKRDRPQWLKNRARELAGELQEIVDRLKKL